MPGLLSSHYQHEEVLMDRQKIPVIGVVVLATAVAAGPIKSAAKNVFVVNDAANPVQIQGGVTVDDVVSIEGAVGLEGTADVSVVNVPFVEIANTASNPIPVQGLSQEERDVFQVRVGGPIPDGTASAGTPIDLPAGKQFVVEYISARFDAPVGEDYSAYVSVSTFYPQSQAVGHWFPAEFHGLHVANGMKNLHFISQPTRMYLNWNAVGGNDIYLDADRWPTTGGFSYTVTLTGYLVDQPQL